jgi:hypothetical protein
MVSVLNNFIGNFTLDVGCEFIENTTFTRKLCNILRTNKVFPSAVFSVNFLVLCTAYLICYSFQMLNNSV